MSSVSSQGPFSGVAPSCPGMAAACCDASASADGGRPSTTSGSVTSFLNALVASRTLLENCVDSLESSCCTSLNRSLPSPSSATPPSVKSRSSASTALRRASESRENAAPSALSAANAS